ncbi:MAG: hypothetical protein ACLTDZ_01860 [Oscillospiraceae bacterium]
MKIGTDQYNTFDTMTMDCWNDRVYYEGKEFPAGHFAAEILNFAGAIHDPLLERITVLTALVDDLSTAEKSKRHDIAAQLKPLLRNTVSWLYTSRTPVLFSPLNWMSSPRICVRAPTRRR